jgi:hypothetical protein
MQPMAASTVQHIDVCGWLIIGHFFPSSQFSRLNDVGGRAVNVDRVIDSRDRIRQRIMTTDRRASVRRDVIGFNPHGMRFDSGRPREFSRDVVSPTGASADRCDDD